MIRRCNSVHVCVCTRRGYQYWKRSQEINKTFTRNVHHTIQMVVNKILFFSNHILSDRFCCAVNDNNSNYVQVYTQFIGLGAMEIRNFYDSKFLMYAEKRNR